jgi:hypothetical protein
MSALKMFVGDGPVMLDNALSRLQYLNFAYNKDMNDANVNSKLDMFLKSLFQLNDQHPLQLLEFAKESHCLAFNRMLHLIRAGCYRDDWVNMRDSIWPFKESERPFVLERVFGWIIDEAISILGNLKLEDQSKNQESFKIINNLVTIAREFANKIQDKQVRE